MEAAQAYQRYTETNLSVFISKSGNCKLDQQVLDSVGYFARRPT